MLLDARGIGRGGVETGDSVDVLDVLDGESCLSGVAIGAASGAGRTLVRVEDRGRCVLPPVVRARSYNTSSWQLYDAKALVSRGLTLEPYNEMDSNLKRDRWHKKRRNGRKKARVSES